MCRSPTGACVRHILPVAAAAPDCQNHQGHPASRPTGADCRSVSVPTDTNAEQADACCAAWGMHACSPCLGHALRQRLVDKAVANGIATDRTLMFCLLSAKCLVLLCCMQWPPVCCVRGDCRGVQAAGCICSKVQVMVQCRSEGGDRDHHHQQGAEDRDCKKSFNWRGEAGSIRRAGPVTWRSCIEAAHPWHPPPWPVHHEDHPRHVSLRQAVAFPEGGSPEQRPTKPCLLPAGDRRAVKAWIKEKKAKKAVVVGGGFIGLRFAAFTVLKLSKGGAMNILPERGQFSRVQCIFPQMPTSTQDYCKRLCLAEHCRVLLRIALGRESQVVL
eukprot:364899-Chlamydomonas_euryale.AAC.46